MGLDMYAYVAAQAGQQREYYEDSEWDPVAREFSNKSVTKPREIAYWRKHPNLHGWFHQLWNSKGFEGNFNGDELELTWDDLDQLEHVIREGKLPGTTGFFFGEPADDYYREQDLEFIKTAKAELFLGLKVFYNSSW
jgi:hypothetical protein